MCINLNSFKKNYALSQYRQVRGLRFKVLIGCKGCLKWPIFLKKEELNLVDIKVNK